MKATQTLPQTYRPGALFNLATLRMMLAVNTAGLLGLFAFGWFFLQLGGWVRPEITTPGPRQIAEGLGVLGFLLTLLGTIVLHELVHGFFFWLYTRARPKFGFNILYAYAAAPDWYFPRNQFMWVGLAPLVILTLVGVVLLPVVSFSWVPALLLGLIVNAAGSVGDLWVVGWLAGRPRESLLQDRGPKMQIFLPQLPALQAQWQALMAGFGVAADDAQAAFTRLVAQYEIGDRHYHTLLHIQDVLAKVDDLSAFATEPETVLLAAWYHDAVYVAQQPDNEAQSTQFARAELTTLGLPAGLVTEVQRLILLTAGYHLPTWEQTGREDRNGHVLLDADLAGLASPWTTFKENAEAIRREFASVPWETYLPARQRVLKQFLDRERIFYTPPMFAGNEEQARKNIKQELTLMREELLQNGMTA